MLNFRHLQSWPRFLSILLAALILSVSLPSQAIQVVAVVGQVHVQRGRAQQQVAMGATLREGDQLYSALAGEVLVQFDDGAQLVLRGDSQLDLKILDTQSEEGLQRRTLELIKGGLRYLSGLVPARSQVMFITTNAVVGIRGTDLEIAVVQQAINSNAPGTYLKVNTGSATLKAQDDTQVDVQAGHVAYGGQPEFVSKDGSSSPAARKLFTPLEGVFIPGQLDRLLR